MLYKLTIILILLLANRLSTQAQVTTLFGKLANNNKTEELTLLNEALLFKGNNYEQIIYPDSLGNFSINLNLDVPSYFLIGYNQVYLKPGDSLQVSLDMKDPNKAQFSGKTSAEQEFLINVPRTKSGSFLDGGRKVKKNYEETIQAVFSVAESRYTALNKLANTSAEFNTIERGRINADILNSLNSIFSYATHINKIPQEKWDIEVKTIEGLTKPLKDSLSVDFVDPTLLQLTSYQNVINIIIKNNPTHPDTRLLKEFQSSMLLNSKLNTMGDQVDTIVLKDIESKINTLSNPKIKSALTSNVKRLKNIDNLQYELTFRTKDDQQKSISEFKDKIIYIDLWATWCIPCLEEREIYKTLSSLYKDDVIFLALSIDRDFDKWKKFIEKEEDNHVINGIVNNYQIADFNVITIPRYILFNKNLKLIDFHADKPQSIHLKEKLNELIKSNNLQNAPI